MIYDLKSSVDLRWLFDLVLHSSLDDYVDDNSANPQVRYFAAGKDRGVFVTLNKLTKLDAGENIVDEEANETSLCESTLSR